MSDNNLVSDVKKNLKKSFFDDDGILTESENEENKPRVSNPVVHKEFFPGISEV